jgi:hypothetical protein
MTREPRPKLAPISEDMKEWSALLGTELSSWPAVTSRRMFGMTAFYRKKRIFAVLPRTRAFGESQSIGFKMERKTPQIRKHLAADPRIVPREDAKWISLEIIDEKDLKNALKWLDRAYRECR